MYQERNYAARAAGLRMSFRSILYLGLSLSKSEAHDYHVLAAAPFFQPPAYSIIAHHLYKMHTVLLYHGLGLGNH